MTAPFRSIKLTVDGLQQRKMMKNQHLSYSRLSRYEQCPLSFKLHYIDQKQAEPGVPLRFGKAVHAVLEILVREHMEQECEGQLSEERAASLWQKAWAANELSGVDVFQEGLGILRSYVSRQGNLNHKDVLAVEKEFLLQVGRFTVLGFIDRVDWVDDETVEVIDYKTNRMLFTRDEVDTSLQLSLYEIAVRKIWPWVKKVRLAFDMLRHDIRMTTERTEEQLDAALVYVETLGEMTERATEYPARINSNCIYCDHRQNCPNYADALKGKRDVVCEDMSDLEAVAREREEVANLAKILYARKSELEAPIKAYLKEHDELVAAGTRYSMLKTSSYTYPVAETIEMMQRETGIQYFELASLLTEINKKALDKLIKGYSQSPAQARMLQAELESIAKVRHSPRLWAKGGY